MSKLSQLQHWAERYARKLGLADQVAVVYMPHDACWPGSNRVSAHCHIEGALRGLICVARAWKPRRGDTVRMLMAHEVVHLAAKGKHGASFARTLAKVAPSQRREALMHNSGALRHHHRWVLLSRGGKRHSWCTYGHWEKCQRASEHLWLTSLSQSYGEYCYFCKAKR